MTTDWDPRPISTEHIVVARELERLIEVLAENTHDIWGRQRIDDGWTVGVERRDDTREHPSLIPYADLSESEKRYDRAIVEGTVRAIIALGFCIAPIADEPPQEGGGGEPGHAYTELAGGT